MAQTHIPVLLNACIEGLNIRPDGIYVDCTLGRGGHSLEIVKRLTAGRLIGIDRDAAAIEQAGARLAPYAAKTTLVRGNFSDLDEILASLQIGGVHGVLLDLGVSSPQLDDAGRGFSYMHDAPLDMRMDDRQTLTAREIVNNWPETELKRIFFEYGEERWAQRIAAAVVSARSKKTVETTFELTEIIRSAMPASALREKQHPAKRCFQAIRIAVNDELTAVSAVMDKAIDALLPGGRLAVISFHSLEDRIVKNALKARTNGCTCPPDLPVCVCGFKPTLKIVTRKPIEAGREELQLNPRSRSAKLRIAEKI